MACRLSLGQADLCHTLLGLSSSLGACHHLLGPVIISWGLSYSLGACHTLLGPVILSLARLTLTGPSLSLCSGPALSLRPLLIDFATTNGLFTICGLNYRLGPVYIVYVPCSLLSMINSKPAGRS